MPLLTDPQGRPLPQQKQDPPGYYRDQQGRLHDQQGRVIDEQTGRPIQQPGMPTPLPPQRTDPASFDRNPDRSYVDPARAAAAGGYPATPGGPATQGGGPRPGGGAPPPNGAKPVANAPAPGGAPPPGPAPQRSYDAKGHASDGSQSTGLDNPWKIGAAVGGTYDHDNLAQLAAIADGKAQGPITPGEAAYILRTVGFQPDGQPNYEQRWADSRKLDRYAQGAGGGTSPWWHDPANAPDKATGDKYGGAYKDEAQATASYGWWNSPDGRPQAGGAQQPATPDGGAQQRPLASALPVAQDQGGQDWSPLTANTLPMSVDYGRGGGPAPDDPSAQGNTGKPSLTPDTTPDPVPDPLNDSTSRGWWRGR